MGRATQPTLPQREPGPRHETPLRSFFTPAGHFTKPLDNLLVATTNLAALPIMGHSPIKFEARNAIEMLKIAVTQQANYSHSRERLHSTPAPGRSRSHHVDSPDVSSSTRQHHEPPRVLPHMRAPNAQYIVDSARAQRAAEAANDAALSPSVTTQLTPTGRTLGIPCLAPALRNERMPLSRRLG